MLVIRNNNFLAFVTLFWLIFDIKLIGSLGSSFLTLLICSFLIVVNPRKYYENVKNVLSCFSWFFIFYLVLFLYVLIRVTVDGASDLSYLLTMSKTTLILISAISYLFVFYNSDIKNNFINVFFVNACICLFFGTFPENKKFLTPFQYGGDEVSELLGSNEYRNAFLSGSGYFGISSLYGLAFAFCLKLVVDSKRKIDYFKLLIIGIAGLFAGRVALVCYGIAILYFVIVKKNLKILFFSIFSFFIFIFIINTVPSFEGVKLWFDEMFFNKSIGNSESFSQFKETFLIPNNTITLMFGDARYGSATSYYGGSDSGYIRNIFFGGLFYLFILMSTFLFLVYKVRNFLYIYLFVFISLFLHFKGVFIFNNPGFFGVFLIVCIYFYKINQKRVLKK